MKPGRSDDRARGWGLMAMFVVAAALLAWAESDVRLLLLAVVGGLAFLRRAEPMMLTVALVVLVVAGLDAGLVLAGLRPLGHRVRGIAAQAVAPHSPLIEGTCPKLRYLPGTVDHGVVRDARGWAVVEVPGEGSPLDIAIVGDSVMDGTARTVLVEALSRAGRAGRVVDVAVVSLNWLDEACVLRELHGEDLDVVIGGSPWNDLPLPGAFVLDVGAGPRRYTWSTFIRSDLSGNHHPSTGVLPVWVSSETRWFQRHGERLREAWGDELLLDVDRPDAFAPLVDVIRSRHTASWAGGLVEALPPGVPAVWIAWPPNVGSAEETIGRLHAEVVQVMSEAGLGVVDASPLLEGHPQDRLYGHDDEIYDTIHYGDPAMAVVLAEVFRRIAPQETELAAALEAEAEAGWDDLP